MITGEKMPAKIINGVRFFNFPIGAQYVINDKEVKRTYVLEIIGASYSEKSQTEYYTCTQNGIELPAALSANRIKYLVSRYCSEALANGKRKIFPLTVEEVQMYYGALKSQKEGAKRQARILARTDEKYQALVAKKKTLEQEFIKIVLARQDATREAILEAELSRIDDCMRGRLSELGVDVSIYDNKCQCPHCRDTGIDGNGICACAVEKTQEIKEFCATYRMRASNNEDPE